LPAPSHHTQPLVTIVIPSYNRLKLLQEAVASVISQTYTNWELIIVDDGSTDGTKESIRSLNEPRIQVLSLAHCGNIAVLRNAGVNIGKGEWVAFLDSDDIWMPRKLEQQLKLLQQHKGSWSYGGFELMDESGHSIALRAGNYDPLSGWVIAELLSNTATASIGTLMIGRKLFEKTAGFNEQLKAREDFEFALRLSMEAEVIAVPEVLVRIREHTERRTYAFANGYERTAFVYQHFINTCADRKLRLIASKRLAHELTNAAKKNIKLKRYRTAAVQLSKAIANGDRLRHVLSIFR
jgi:glycosyltransferase involved in cell wall biosynthesis